MFANAIQVMEDLIVNIMYVVVSYRIRLEQFAMGMEIAPILLLVHVLTLSLDHFAKFPSVMVLLRIMQQFAHLMEVASLLTIVLAFLHIPDLNVSFPFVMVYHQTIFEFVLVMAVVFFHKIVLVNLNSMGTIVRILFFGIS